MATVTMNTNEYNALMKELWETGEKLAQVEEWLVRATELTFDDEDRGSWGAGKMPGMDAPMPHWMKEFMFNRVAAHVMAQDCDTLMYLEEKGARFYTPFEKYLSTWGNEEYLSHFDGLEKVWEHAHADNQAKKNAEEKAVESMGEEIQVEDGEEEEF